MKLKILTLSLIAILVCSWKQLCAGDEMDRALCAISKKIESNFNVVTDATGVSCFGGILTEVEYYFASKSETNIDEARKLSVEIAQEFLALVNADIVLKKHMKNYPFNQANISFTLFFFDEKHNMRVDPFVGSVDVWGDKFIINFYEKDNLGPIKKIRETFEEARCKVYNTDS